MIHNSSASAGCDEQQANVQLSTIPLITAEIDGFAFAYNFQRRCLVRSPGRRQTLLRLMSLDPEAADLLREVPRTDPDHAVARIQLFPTLACNMLCRYCYNSSGGSGPGACMESWVVESAIRFACRARPEYLFVHFIGGEPTLAPAVLAEAITFADDLVPYTDYYIVTNGTFSTKVLRLLIDHDFDVIVSLDGPQQVNDRYRRYVNGRSSFDTVTENISALAAAGNRLVVRSMITSEGLSALAEFIDFLAGVGVRRLRLEPLLTAAGRARQLRLQNVSPRSVLAAFKDAVGLAMERGISVETSLTKYLLLGDRRFKRPIIVLPNGDLTASAVVCRPEQSEYLEFCYGRLLPGGEAFVDDSKRERLRERFEIHSRSNCYDCGLVGLCGGRLRGYEFSLADPGDEGQTACELYRAMFDVMIDVAQCRNKAEVGSSQLSVWHDTDLAPSVGESERGVD